MVVSVNRATKMIRRTKVLDAVTLDLCGGKIYGLSGPNGSGKTMLLRLISGLIRPTEGEVYIDGKKLGRDLDFPASMGLLLENPAFLPNNTGRKNLELLASVRGRPDPEQIRKALFDVGLDPDDKRKYRKYSLGMKQRLGIAASIMEKPELILLDEPTNALDADGVRQICSLILRERNRGALVIVACHDAAILDHLADEIYDLDHGKVNKRKADE